MSAEEISKKILYPFPRVTSGHFPNSHPASLPLDKIPLSWMALILPQLDQSPLAAATDLALKEAPINHYKNPPHVGLTTVIKSFCRPADARLVNPLTEADGIKAAYTSYIGVRGGSAIDGVLYQPVFVRMADISDGMSSTIVLGERSPPDTLKRESGTCRISLCLWYAIWSR